MNIEIKKPDITPGEKELEKLLYWIVGHHDEWECICNLDIFILSGAQRLEIIRSLEEEGLLSIAYVVLFLAGDRSREMEVIREKIINEIMTGISPEKLMKVIEKNME